MHALRRVAQVLGTVAFWLTWPVTFWYFRGSQRTRIFVRSGDKMLMTKGWLSAGKWALPGGGLHAGEQPLDGALRELDEEVGLRLSPADLRVLGQHNVGSRGMVFTAHCFATELPATVPLKLQRHEIAEARWLPLAQLTPANTEPDAWQLLAEYSPRGDN